MRFNPAYSAYRALTSASEPLVRRWLERRQAQGKEDAARIGERFGYPSLARPEGQLLWVHASSIGEAHSVLPLLETLRKQAPNHQMLLTTGTVSSARVLAPKLPSGVLHHYVPVDTPQAVARFLAHWRPDAALFVESELWPNLMMMSAQRGVRMALVNARMSARSFRRWRCLWFLIRPLMRCFDVVFAQTHEDGARFEALGAEVAYRGNIKCDAAALPVDGATLAAWSADVRSRPVWLAASTHPGEEEALAAAHRSLLELYPDLLCIIVPRHPARGDGLARMLRARGFTVAQRSTQEPLGASQFYIADTLGELGLFFRACRIVFMGGSLVAHGGQNPLEAARLGCALLYGPHMFNFSEICAGLEAEEAALRVRDAQTLYACVASCLSEAGLAEGMAQRAKDWLARQSGAGVRIVAELRARGWW